LLLLSIAVYILYLSSLIPLFVIFWFNSIMTSLALGIFIKTAFCIDFLFIFKILFSIFLNIFVSKSVWRTIFSYNFVSILVIFVVTIFSLNLTTLLLLHYFFLLCFMTRTIILYILLFWDILIYLPTRAIVHLPILAIII